MLWPNNHACFVAPEEELVGKLTVPGGDIWLNSIFFNVHNTDVTAPIVPIHELGFVCRIWRIDDQGEYDRALASKAQMIATDHVTQDLFHPRLVDAVGHPYLAY
jgi:hypothetical protein